MPCDQMQEEYGQFLRFREVEARAIEMARAEARERANQERLVRVKAKRDEDRLAMKLAKENPFAYALRLHTRSRGWTGRITGYYMVGFDEFKVTLSDEGYEETLYVNLGPDLHDMALLKVPGPEPDEPPTFAYLRAQVRYDAVRPKDLLDKPIPEMQWRWKRVVSVDPEIPDRFEKEWYAVETPPDSIIARAKKRIIRVIEVDEVQPDKPVRVERVIEEQEVTD